MNAKYKVTVLALTLGFLAGCSTPTQKFIFSPNYTQTHQKMVQQDVSLSVNDRRASFTTVTIKNSDGNQTLADKYLADAYLASAPMHTSPIARYFHGIHSF